MPGGSYNYIIIIDLNIDIEALNKGARVFIDQQHGLCHHFAYMFLVNYQ